MHAQLNLYCHGYVAVPILEACAKQGLFKLLADASQQKSGHLIKQHKANPGYFTLILPKLFVVSSLQPTDDHI